MDCRGTVRYELHVSVFSEVLQAWAAQAGTSHCKSELLREGGFLIQTSQEKYGFGFLRKLPLSIHKKQFPHA